MIILILSIFAVSVFSIARLVLYFTYFRKQKPLTGKEIRYCFKRGVHFDLSIFSTLFGLPVLLFFLPFPFTVSPVYQSFIFALWGLLFLFLLAVTAGDLIYFKYVNRHLTNELSFIFSEAGVLLRTLCTTYRKYAFFGGLFFVAAVFFWLYTLFSITQQNAFPGYTAGTLRFITVLGLLIYLIHGNGLSGKPLATVDAHSLASRDQAAIIMNGLFSSIHSVYRAQKSENIQIMTLDSAVQNVLGVTSPVQIQTGTNFPMLQQYFSGSGPLFKKPNIVLLVIEGFSAHNVPSIFQETPSPWAKENPMPFLSRLASEALLFPNFYANGQRTLDMVHTLLTSIPRLANSPLIGYGQDFSTVQYKYLPQLLKEAGYLTTCFNGPWQKSIHMDSIASLTGFDSYFHGGDINRDCLKKSGLAPSEVGAWDEHLFEFVHEKLRGEERPVFSLIFTATSHAPYQVPEREKHPFGTEGDLQKYFNCNRYLDAVLADFFKKVPGNPNLENTLFFITGDHTIFPLEKRWETTSLFHLPLFIYGKNHISSGVDKRLGSHMDLFPTLLHAAGYAGPMVNFGRSLLKKGGKNFSVMSQGNTLHATDGEEWLILPHILSPPESFKIQEGYFLKKQQSLCSRELLSLTQSYVQTVHTLFKENRYYP